MEESWEVWGGCKRRDEGGKKNHSGEYVSAKYMTQEKLEKLELETAVGAF